MSFENFSFEIDQDSAVYYLGFHTVNQNEDAADVRGLITVRTNTTRKRHQPFKSL